MPTTLRKWIAVYDDDFTSLDPCRLCLYCLGDDSGKLLRNARVQSDVNLARLRIKDCCKNWPRGHTLGGVILQYDFSGFACHDLQRCQCRYGFDLRSFG